MGHGAFDRGTSLHLRDRDYACWHIKLHVWVLGQALRSAPTHSFHDSASRSRPHGLTLGIGVACVAIADVPTRSADETERDKDGSVVA